MLIGLVRDSVLQCFCHSCKAPLSIIATQRKGAAPTKKPSGKGKPRTKQPKKKVKFITTEIRAQEKTKGGLRYEVILAEPSAPAKRVPSPTESQQPQLPQQQQQPNSAATSPSNGCLLTLEDKLRAAEERRLSLEAEKLAKQKAALEKIEEAARKRDSLESSFVKSTRESLDKKLNSSEEKRDAIIADIKNRMKDHLVGVDNTRQKKHQQKTEQEMQEIRNAIDEKIKAAETLRQENHKKMLERLKEHEDQIARARQGLAQKTQSLEANIQAKLEHATERRKTLEQEQLDKIRDHWGKILMVREEKKAQAKVQSSEDKVTQETASSG